MSCLALSNASLKPTFAFGMRVDNDKGEDGDGMGGDVDVIAYSDDDDPDDDPDGRPGRRARRRSGRRRRHGNRQRDPYDDSDVVGPGEPVGPPTSAAPSLV